MGRTNVWKKAPPSSLGWHAMRSFSVAHLQRRSPRRSAAILLLQSFSTTVERQTHRGRTRHSEADPWLLHIMWWNLVLPILLIIIVSANIVSSLLIFFFICHLPYVCLSSCPTMSNVRPALCWRNVCWSWGSCHYASSWLLGQEDVPLADWLARMTFHLCHVCVGTKIA